MKNTLFLSLMAFSFLFVNQSFAQNMEISAEAANLKMSDQELKTYLVEIGGPDAYYWKETVEKTTDIQLSNRQADGTVFSDGVYTLQVTPVFTLTPEQRATILDLRSKNDIAGIKTFREANNLPDQVDQMVVNFSIKNGKFVMNTNKEAKMTLPSYSLAWNQDHPSLYASVEPMMGQVAANPVLDETNLSEDAQVIATDLVVQGSACFGFDCVSSESFGFDTNRLKENNLRIHFDDTSNSASFPGNDWRISANDTSNGGDNYLAFEDATAGTTPFKVEAGAGNSALHVDASGGNVGMGTATPVLELHIADGDSPSIRIEQNGSNGWTPQTWDIAGNETNFFVRDVTNGSKLPFKIRPGAPDNALYINTNGDIGLGTASPADALHVKSGDVYVENGFLGIGVDPTVALDVFGSMKVTGNPVFIGNATFSGNLNTVIPGASTFLSSASLTNMLSFDGITGFVGIAMPLLTNPTPSYPLEVGSDMVYKPTGGSWLGASDRRLKKDIKDYTDGLEKLMEIRTVTYRYNGKLGLPSEKENVGIIAQEMQEIAPYMISSLKNQSEEAKGQNYLAYDGSALTYMLVNAVQEQQAIIDAQKSEINTLQSELASLQTLKAEVAALAELVKSQKEVATEAVGEE